MWSITLVLTLLSCFGCAILSGIGVGSAGIFTLCLTAFLGYAQTEAQALNLAFFIFSAGVSLLILRRTRIFPRRVIALLIFCALPGTLAGSYLARVLDPSILRRLFGGMLVVTGAMGLVGSMRARRADRAKKP